MALSLISNRTRCKIIEQYEAKIWKRSMDYTDGWITQSKGRGMYSH